jgi:hypothetical protein
MTQSDDTPSGRLAPEVQQTVEGYVCRLEECIASCTYHGRMEPEIFLWQARRTAEAICLILLTVRERKVIKNPWSLEGNRGRKDGPAHTSLATLIEDLARNDMLDEEEKQGLETIRANSNPGVHLIRPDRPDYPVYVGAVMGVLPMLVHRLFSKSRAAPHLRLSAELRSNLETLAKKAEGNPSLVSQIRTLEKERVEFFGEIARLKSEIEVERTRPRASPGRGCLGLAAPLAAGLLLGATLGVLAQALFTTLSSPSSPSGPAVNVAPTPEPVEQAPSPPPVPPPALTAPPSCPEGMIEIAASTIRIGQPQRKTWPKPTRTRLAPVEVPAFCIDAGPRPWASLDDRETLSRASTPCGDKPRDRRSSAPAVCVDRPEADATCRAEHPKARLPGIAEWEALRRSERWREFSISLPREWVADRFPPTIFPREASPSADGDGMFRDRSFEPEDFKPAWSWNRQDPTKRWENLGFRCMIPFSDL